MTQWVSIRSAAELANDAEDLFTQHFSAQPAGVWAAPGRVNVIGDHVDYAEGVCIPFALTQLTAVAAAPRTDGHVRIVSLIPGDTVPQTFEIGLSEVGPGHPANWAGYVVGVLWAGLESGILPHCDGLDIAIVSDVPVGSGLSSSAALECSVAIAAFELATGRQPALVERDELANACIRAENDVVGASTGGLDQTTSLFGEVGNALVIDFGLGVRAPVPFDLASHDLALLIANTNAPHTLSDGQYANRRGLIDEILAAWDGEDTSIRAMDVETAVDYAGQWALAQGRDVELTKRRVRHVASEIQRTQQAAQALDKKDMDTFAQLMRESHISLRDDYEVVTPELESAFRAAGEVGARMTGGGFGGSVIALVTQDAVTETAERIAQAAETAGFAEPTFCVATPGQGARRIK